MKVKVYFWLVRGEAAKGDNYRSFMGNVDDHDVSNCWSGVMANREDVRRFVADSREWQYWYAGFMAMPSVQGVLKRDEYKNWNAMFVLHDELCRKTKQFNSQDDALFLGSVEYDKPNDNGMKPGDISKMLVRPPAAPLDDLEDTLASTNTFTSREAVQAAVTVLSGGFRIEWRIENHLMGKFMRSLRDFMD